MSLPVAPKPALRRFHQARWDEPILTELSTPGERGVLVSQVEPGVRETVGDVLATLPADLRRADAPALPEMGSSASSSTTCVCPRRRSAPTSTSTSVRAPAR